MEQRLRHPNIYLKDVKCGKKGCTMCPHPDFFYMIFTDGLGKHNMYIGKRWKLPMLVLNEKSKWKPYRT